MGEFCEQASPRQYVPLAGSELSDVKMCPANTQHSQALLVRRSPFTIQLQPREGATSQADCTCVEGTHLTETGACKPCVRGAVCWGSCASPGLDPSGSAATNPEWRGRDSPAQSSRRTLLRVTHRLLSGPTRATSQTLSLSPAPSEDHAQEDVSYSRMRLHWEPCARPRLHHRCCRPLRRLPERPIAPANAALLRTISRSIRTLSAQQVAQLGAASEIACVTRS
ncbi:hypothetical protein OAO87_02430 [bacterium]|nr:hypothetical protein [bacterium]